MRYNHISKPFFVILEIVKDTPLISIDAFSISIFLYFLSTLNSKIFEDLFFFIYILLKLCQHVLDIYDLIYLDHILMVILNL